MLKVPVEEYKHMDSKFSMMKQYASILHGSIFREPFGEKLFSGHIWVLLIFPTSGSRC